MIAAIIFDLDGTVVDNEAMWEEAFQAILAKAAVVVGSDFRQPNGWVHEPGIGLVSNWKRLLKDDIGSQASKLAAETAEEYKRLSKAGEVMVRVGLDKVIEKAIEKKLALALATSSVWHTVEKELESLNLYLAFEVTTTGEEVGMPKPDPEIYVLTAQKLGLEPSECLVVEDSVAGVRAAVEAGCQVVGLMSDYAPKELLAAAGANKVVEGMGEVSEDVDEWLKIVAER